MPSGGDHRRWICCVRREKSDGSLKGVTVNKLVAEPFKRLIADEFNVKSSYRTDLDRGKDKGAVF